MPVILAQCSVKFRKSSKEREGQLLVAITITSNYTFAEGLSSLLITSECASEDMESQGQDSG